MKKSKSETRRFESDALALPPLKMALVDTEAIRSEGRKKASKLRRIAKGAKYKAAVEKLIVHLTKI